MATVIAFTSGKGDVGKTTISTNLALSLAARNKRVCLLDTDIQFSNINNLLGIKPRYTLEHVLLGQKKIDEIIVDLSSGISIVQANFWANKKTSFAENQLDFLIASFKKLEENFDYLLIDAATGIETNVIDITAAAQYQVVVITSEPNSLTDAFAILKMLIIRGKKKSIFVVVNKVDDYQSSQIVFNRFQKAVYTYLNIEVNYLGYLSTDAHVNKAIAQHIPVVISYPDSAVSCGFASLADVVKIQFSKEKNKPYFSQFWQLNTTSVSKKKTISVPSHLLTEDGNKKLSDNYLNDFYDLLDQQQLSEQKLKELIITLEYIYEKKYKQAARDMSSVVALILAEGNAERIQHLHTAIEHSYERQFGKKITNPVIAIQTLLKDDKFSKKYFNRVMDNFTDIYQQRFSEKYFSDGNQLLTEIQHLLSNHHTDDEL